MPEKPRPIKTILVATGLTMESVGGVLLAQRLAELFGAELHAVHVITPLSPETESAIPGIAETHDRMAMEELEKFASSHGLDTTAAKLHVARGSASAEIVRVRYEIGADLLVLGRYGKGGLKHGAIGSVAARVARKIPVSVLIALPEFRGDIKSVGVATSLTPDSDLAILRAAELAAKFGLKEVALLHAYTVPAGFERYCSWDEAKNKLEDVARKRADETIERLQPLLPPGITLRFHVREGPKGKAVPALAGDLKLDLLVLSTHGRSSSAIAILGHTTETIINNAPCSVWTETSPSKVQGFFEAMKHVLG